MHIRAEYLSKAKIGVKFLSKQAGSRVFRPFFMLVAALTLVVAGSQGVTAFEAINLVSNAGPGSILQEDVNHIHGVGTVGVLAESAIDSTFVVNIERARAGTQSIDNTQPVPWGSHVRIGSTTKTFVSTVMLQLAAEGKLSLDDTVDKWLPGVIKGNGNNGKHITIRELLQHTSGLPDYVSTDAFFNTVASAEAFDANRYNTYTPKQLLDFALEIPSEFPPGTQWSYSNTNHIVAGMVIKKVTGQTWAQQVKKRIITPLGLTETSEPGTNPALPVPYPRAYELFDVDNVYTDVTEQNMTWADAAGSLISTPRDVNKFFRALMKGQLLPPAQMQAMKTTVEMPEDYQAIWPGARYGLGIIRSDLPCGGTYWHHGGDAFGYSDRNGVTGDGRESVMVAPSTNTIADEDFAVGSERYTDELVRNALCDDDTDPSSTSSPQTFNQKNRDLLQRRLRL